MDNGSSLQASFWLMVILQTIGSVDMPGSGPRKMPAPRSYVAIIIVWSVLQLIADSGKEHAASVMGWVTLLTGMIVGPFGGRLLKLFNSAVKLVPNANPSNAPAGVGDFPPSVQNALH